MNKRLEVTFTGNLEKSGLRFAILEKGLELNLIGNVPKYSERKLIAEVQGEIENLQKFLKWAHSSPEKIKIESITYQSFEDLKEFEKLTAEY